jgi:hypothetical protein
VQIGKTGYRALDEVVEHAAMPKRCDRVFAAMFYGRLLGQPCSEHTFRRLPIPYKKTGRSASYLVDDIIAAAQQVIAEAPIHTPPERPRKKRLRRAVAQPPAPADRQHQPATQPEKKTESAS